LLAANHGAQTQASAAPAFAPGQPVAFARSDGPALHGLFRTDTRRGPISEEVAQLWQAGRAAETAPRTAALGGFFPRTIAVPEKPTAVEPVGEEGATEVPVSQPADVPLPPPRPASLDQAQPARPALGRIGRPLDLSAFMSWRRKA
jgi:hypothetical protein